MGDSAVTGFGILVAAILMFMFPLMKMADVTDEAAQLAVQTATTDLTNKVITTAYFTQEDYDNYILTLSATGNSYEPEITVEKRDVNLAKKTSGDKSAIGDDTEYTMYNTQVLNSLPLELNEGDRFTIKVQNTNKTMAIQLRNALYKVTGNSVSTIVAEDSGMVTKTATN